MFPHSFWLSASLSVHNFTASLPGPIKALALSLSVTPLGDCRADTDAASDANFTANSARAWKRRAQFRPHVREGEGDMTGSRGREGERGLAVMKVERRFTSPPMRRLDHYFDQPAINPSRRVVSSLNHYRCG